MPTPFKRARPEMTGFPIPYNPVRVFSADNNYIAIYNFGIALLESFYYF